MCIVAVSGSLSGVLSALTLPASKTWPCTLLPILCLGDNIKQHSLTHSFTTSLWALKQDLGSSWLEFYQRNLTSKAFYLKGPIFRVNELKTGGGFRNQDPKLVQITRVEITQHQGELACFRSRLLKEIGLTCQRRMFRICKLSKCVCFE